MFTICFAVYAGLVTVTPVTETCIKADRTTLTAAIAQCAADAHDPLTTCEARSAGALKWFITRRQLEVGK